MNLAKKRIIVIFIPLIAILFLTTQIAYNIRLKRIRIHDIILKLPDSICTEFSIKLNAPSVVIAFQPDCEHCQYEAKNLNAKSAELCGVNIAFLTSASDSLTKKFKIE